MAENGLRPFSVIASAAPGECGLKWSKNANRKVRRGCWRGVPGMRVEVFSRPVAARGRCGQREPAGRVASTWGHLVPQDVAYVAYVERRRSEAVFSCHILWHGMWHATWHGCGTGPWARPGPVGGRVRGALRARVEEDVQTPGGLEACNKKTPAARVRGTSAGAPAKPPTGETRTHGNGPQTTRW